MTATNHALTGALIGLIIGEPLLAVPAAIASHYLCDILPHYASAGDAKHVLKTKAFRNYLVTEAGICFILVLILAATQPEHWLLACACAFLAAAPDFLWIPRYVKTRAGTKWQPNLFSRFALRIQWFQRPIGAVVEVAWCVACVILLVPFLR